MHRLPSFPIAGLAAVVLFASTAMPTQAVVYTVGSPVGPGQCTHGTLQSAIDAAAASPGLDIIRVTRGIYPAQRLVVDDAGDLAIEGGFLECATLVRVDVSTLDGQGASPPGPVISHRGVGRLTLADLHIRNGIADGAGAATTFGGGVSSTGTGDITVYRSLIHSNRARDGGGMFVLGTAGQVKEVHLIGVGFNSNTATRRGGGLNVSNATVLISGEFSYFAGNRAEGTDINDGGGGLYALSSQVFVEFEGAGPTVQFMDGNRAESNGGAIYFANFTPGSRSLWLSNRNHDGPVTIANNAAARFGGAIYVRASAAAAATSAYANLVNTIVSGNDAAEGGAFYLYGSGSDSIGHSGLSMVTSDANYSAPPCPAHLRCNRADGNGTGLSSTIMLEEGGGLGRATFFINRGHLVDNHSPNGGLVDGYGGTGNLYVNNSVLANNVLGNAPLVYLSTHEARIENSTIAGNIGVAPQVFRVTQPGGALQLHNSIVFQPGIPVRQVDTGATANLRNLLVGDGHGLGDLVALNIQPTPNPLFVNPGQHDFRLQPGSQAINRWAPGGGVNVPSIDLLGANRPAPPSGSPTPYDFGAYEYGAVVDAIFADGFDNN